MVERPKNPRAWRNHATLILFVLLTACGQPIETPSPAVEDFILPEVPLGDQEYQCTFPETPPTTPDDPSEQLGYMQDQIALVGEPADVVTMTTIISDEFRATVEGPIDPIEPLTDRDGNLIAINLYSVVLPNNTTVWDLVADVNAFARDNNLRVLAEPNYLTNLPIGGSGSDGGSGINGDPNTASNLTPVEFGGEQFTRQWAFSGASSIHLFDASVPHNWTPRTAPNAALLGTGVNVVVFDTTPLAQGGHDIDWAMPAGFVLCVWQPGLRFGSSGAVGQPGQAGAISKGEHGLFVTGLAHGVAPAAHYHLVEVLDDQARGDVYSLIRAMVLYRDHLGAGSPTVFNLSLGLDVIRNPGLRNEGALRALRENLGANFLPGAYPYFQELTNQFPAASLKVAAAVLAQNGVVIVAAAGNDGPTTVQQAPAAFSEVIGVASSNASGGPSCFSNPGDLAAPSGDGLRSGPNQCDEHTPAACPAGSAGCEYAVISTVTQPTAALSGHAYWTGTSFSTPMVSALAALLLEANPRLDPASVFITIAGCVTAPTSGAAVLGMGVIDVESCFP